MSDSEEDIVPEEDFEGPGENALKRLREKLAQCVEEKQEYLDGWQRMRADFANEKRIQEKRGGELVALAQAELIGEIIPVLDSFDMALKGAEEAGSWRSGVENIRGQLLSVLKRYGVTSFEPTGEAFDPAAHEPVASVPVTDLKQDQRVVEVLQRGYRTEEKVLRPAKVTVGQHSA